MGDRVRGITLEVAADGAKFNKAMTEIRSNAKSSQSELNALQKSLELEFDSDKFSRAQKVAQEAIDATAVKTDALQKRLQALNDQDKIDTSEYARVKAELAQTELQAQRLEEQLEKINSLRFEQLGKSVEEIGNKISDAGQAFAPVSAAAAAALTSAGALGMKAVSEADNIATLATQYDMTATALQRFDYIALQTDTDSEVLYKAFVKMRAGAAELATGGTSVASTALKQLNLDLNSFDGSEEQFYAIITTLADMEDKTRMVALANDIFGEKLANNLLPLIYSGSDAIATYSEEFENLGALSDEQVSALADFDNVLNTIKTQLSNVVLQIGSSFLPIMESLAGVVSSDVVPKLQTLADIFNSLNANQLEFGVKALGVTAILSPLTIGIGKLVSTVGSVIKVLPVLQSGLSVLAAHPIVAIVIAVAALLLLIYTRCESFRESISNLASALGGVLQPVLSTVMSLLSSVFDMLMPLIDILGGILGTVVNLITNALAPLFNWISLFFSLIEPLIAIALIPLQLALIRLQIPLQLLGVLFSLLTSLLGGFADFSQLIFSKIIDGINFLLSGIEKGINWCIDKINYLVDVLNDVGGTFGVSVSKIEKVSLQIDPVTFGASGATQKEPDYSIDMGNIGVDPYSTYDDIGAGGTTGDIYNYDNSTNNTTQNVTVVIENYSSEVDVDNLVREINIKLAEAM